MKSIWAVTYGVVIGLIATGIILLVSHPPRGNAITLLPPPSPVPWVVYVSGEVVRPDVYTLPAGSRMRDAILAAGGFTQDADYQTLNLASVLTDGATIHVLKMVFNTNTNSTDVSTRVGGTLININTATQEELDTLPQIGPALAQRIIAFRNANGPFAILEDIQKVSGIGPTTFEKIKVLITVVP